MPYTSHSKRANRIHRTRTHINLRLFQKPYNASCTPNTYSEGIIHGLPTFPVHDAKKYTAIVTGSNGISGSEVVRALATSFDKSGRGKTVDVSGNPPVCGSILLSGPELLTLNENQWEQLCRYDEVVFARTTPEQKVN